VPPDVGRSYLHRPETKNHSRATFERSASYDRRPSYEHTDRYEDDYDDRALHSRSRHAHSSRAGPSTYSYRSPSPPPRAAPAFQPYEPTFRSTRDSHVAASPGPSSSIGSERGQSVEPHPIMQGMEPPPVTRKGAWRPDDSLNANEEIWQEHLRQFQQRREFEAATILSWTPEMGNGKPEPPAKVPVKRRGWPKDHPTRIAQREAKERAIAAGIPLPKKQYKRKPKANATTSAAIDDELLGLAEGDDVKPSSPMPASSVIDDDGEMTISDPNGIILPCGLTRAEVMTKVEAGDMRGLTEDDVKQVQDEMWLRKSGPPQLRKDGTLRKKPGPAKGWKAMRKMKEAAAHDDDSDAASVLNGEAEADIAALLDDDVPKRKPAKRRKKDTDVKPDLDDDVRSRLGEEEDELLPSDAENGELHAPSKPKRKSGKTKEPGVGKGNWTRPSKETKQSGKKGDALQALEAAVDTDGEAEVVEPPPPRKPQHQPNTYDPRGISEAEAHVRLDLVEELQRQAWASICRDVPKVSSSPSIRTNPRSTGSSRHTTTSSSRTRSARRRRASATRSGSATSRRIAPR
jgi:DNA helicase INO80